MTDSRSPHPDSLYPLDVLLTGVYFCDLIFTGLPHMPVLGQEIFGSGFDLLPGGTFNMAIALHRLGLKVGWQCDFGSDFFSRFVLDAARKAGLDDRFFRVREAPLRNLTVSLSFAEDRAFVTFADLFRPPSVSDVMTSGRARCVALPVFYYQPDIVALGQRIRDQGGLLFMDCAQIDVTLETPGVIEALGAVDVFAPNETEALQITGAASIAEALTILAAYAPLIVLKQGARGAIARQGDREIHVPALDGLNVLDTTGAGDCFNAGFLCSYLRGGSLAQSLQLGNIVGGLSTGGRGTQNVPTLAEAERHLVAYSTGEG